jgi:hypothetical protein
VNLLMTLSLESYAVLPAKVRGFRIAISSISRLTQNFDAVGFRTLSSLITRYGGLVLDASADSVHVHVHPDGGPVCDVVIRSEAAGVYTASAHEVCHRTNRDCDRLDPTSEALEQRSATATGAFSQRCEATIVSCPLILQSVRSLFFHATTQNHSCSLPPVVC